MFWKCFQMMLEKQKQEEEQAKEAELLRQQQLAVEMQRHEEEKVQQQKDMLHQHKNRCKSFRLTQSVTRVQFHKAAQRQFCAYGAISIS